MNRRFQMQGGKNWIFSEIDQCKPVVLGLSLAGNLVKPLMSLYGTERRYSVAMNSVYKVDVSIPRFTLRERN
jgi:hypothetical protein